MIQKVFYIVLGLTFVLSPAQGLSQEGYFIDLKAFREQTGLRHKTPPLAAEEAKPLCPTRRIQPEKGYDPAERMMDNLYEISRFAARAEKASPSAGMGIRFSQSRNFIDARGLPAVSSEDRMVSDIIETLPDLWKRDSQSQALDRLGRVVEPRVMFYFEF